jgi:hypothetical protein
MYNLKIQLSTLAKPSLCGALSAVAALFGCLYCTTTIFMPSALECGAVVSSGDCFACDVRGAVLSHPYLRPGRRKKLLVVGGSAFVSSFDCRCVLCLCACGAGIASDSTSVLIVDVFRALLEYWCPFRKGVCFVLDCISQLVRTSITLCNCHSLLGPVSWRPSSTTPSVLFLLLYCTSFQKGVCYSGVNL